MVCGHQTRQLPAQQRRRREAIASAALRTPAAASGSVALRGKREKKDDLERHSTRIDPIDHVQREPMDQEAAPSQPSTGPPYANRDRCGERDAAYGNTRPSALLWRHFGPPPKIEPLAFEVSLRDGLEKRAQLLLLRRQLELCAGWGRSGGGGSWGWR